MGGCFRLCFGLNEEGILNTSVPQKEKDYSNMEKFQFGQKMNSSGHHCMSGIYNIDLVRPEFFY